MPDRDAQITAAELAARVAELETEITPAKWLWDGMAEQLGSAPAELSTLPAGGQQPGPGYAWREWAVAAAFALATAAFITFGTIDDQAQLQTTSVRQTEFEKDERYGGDLLRVRQELRTELRTVLEELSPTTRQVVVENLARIEEARAQIEMALEQEPGNRLLEQLLLASYTNELTLLHEFTGVARTAQQRTQL